MSPERKMSDADPLDWTPKDWLAAIQKLSHVFNCWGYAPKDHAPGYDYGLAEYSKFASDLMDLTYASTTVTRPSTYNKSISRDARKVIKWLREVDV